MVLVELTRLGLPLIQRFFSLSGGAADPLGLTMDPLGLTMDPWGVFAIESEMCWRWSQRCVGDGVPL